jgi:ribose transport system ATP-binding protein
MGPADDQMAQRPDPAAPRGGVGGVGGEPVARDISIRGMRKSFGPNEVLHGIDLTIKGGDFLGLMGPNGAGKSTLIKILGGVYSSGAGEIRYGEEVVPNLGSRQEVGFIHQDLGLIDDFSIADNLRLGRTPMRRLGPLLDLARERRAAKTALEGVGLNLPVTTKVGTLSPGEKALVAVARAFDRGAKVLFVDEATSTLPPSDSRRLIDALRESALRGATVIMVSHKLSEILDATTRVVVLLDGRIAADAGKGDLDREALVSMLVTHDRSDAGGSAAGARREPGDALLELRGVGRGRIRGVDLELRAGEVVGVTGLAGSGLHDLAYLAHGTLRPTSGEVVRPAGVKSGLVPPHRETQAGFQDQSVLANLTISSLARWRGPTRLLRPSKERQDALSTTRGLAIRPAEPTAIYGTLSGGNKQKVVLGRLMLAEPEVYILCEPTRGVDIGTRREIYEIVERLAREGAAVLVVSSDSEDLFAVCDRIAVVDDGRLGEFVSSDETNAEQLEAFI